MQNTQKVLMQVYNKLFERFGPRNWWPADTAFEVVVGAILTQNTAWTNVERAINNIKKERLLSAKKLYQLDIHLLARLIRPVGYYNIKAQRLKNFLKFLFDNYNGSLKKLLSLKTIELRRQLLGVNGIGPETADSILLYAAGKPIFVIDAYTKRIFTQHGFGDFVKTYDDAQRFFMKNLPRSAKLFNEYHALIVELGKNICRTKPKCDICPISSLRGAQTKSGRRSNLKYG